MDFGIPSLRIKVSKSLRVLEGGILVLLKANYFKLEYLEESIYIFNKTQKVKFVKSENENLKEYEIDTLDEIHNLLEENKFNSPFIIEEEKTIYLKDSNIMRKLCKPIIYEIKNADSFVKNIGKENTKYVLGENFKPIELSKYFYDFFKFI